MNQVHGFVGAGCRTGATTFAKIGVYFCYFIDHRNELHYKIISNKRKINEIAQEQRRLKKEIMAINGLLKTINVEWLDNIYFCNKERKRKVKKHNSGGQK